MKYLEYVISDSKTVLLKNASRDMFINVIIWEINKIMVDLHSYHWEPICEFILIHAVY
jgi:hypothetical protein